MTAPDVEFAPTDDFLSRHDRRLGEAAAIRFVDEYTTRLNGRSMPWVGYGGPGMEWLLDNSNLSREALLCLLACHPDKAVGMWIASQTEVPADAFRSLATYPDLELLAVVARHSEVPVDVLGFLASHLARAARVAVADTRADLPVAIQTRLAVDADWLVVRQLAHRSDLDTGLATQLTTHEHPLVVTEVIRNDRLPLQTARGLLTQALEGEKSPTWMVDLLSEGVRYDDEAFTNEIADAARNYPAAWQSILTSPTTPVNVLVAAGKRRSTLNVEAATALATNPRTPVETLNRLAKDKRGRVAGGLAANPNTPAEVLRQLVGSDRSEVVMTALGNPSIPSELLTVSLSGRQRLVAAGNPAIAPEVLLAWVNEAVETDKAEEAKRKASGYSWYSRYSHHEQTIRTILQNPVAPAAVWPVVATADAPSKLREVAVAVEGCPADLLMEACVCSDEPVRRAAAANPNCPEEGQVAAALMG